MLTFIYPDRVDAVFRNTAGKLIARAEKAGRPGMHAFEIKGFAVLAPGAVHN